MGASVPFEEDQIRLMIFFRFDEDDLEYNRNGLLSPNQERQILKTSAYLPIAFGLIGVVMSILLFNLLPLMIFGGVGFVIYLVAMNNIDSGTVRFYRGHAIITYLMTTPYIYLRKYSYVLSRGYWYYDGLFNKDAIYKFYHISNQVVSVERVKGVRNLGGKKAKISVKSKAKPKAKRKANIKSRNVS